MLDDKTQEMFEELVAKTEARSLKWEPGASAGEFIATIAGKYTLNFLPYTYIDASSGELEGPPSIEIKDDRGMLLMHIQQHKLDGPSVSLSDFAEVVRRSVYRIDEKVNDLFLQLNKLPGDAKPREKREITDEDIPF